MKHDENLCAEIQSTLPLYVGGDLDTKALSEVRLHLGDCPPCAERALAARAARRDLVAALRMEAHAGPDLWAGVRAALAEDGVLRPRATAGDQPFAAPVTPRRWSRPLSYAAAAAALLFGVWIGARWNDADGPETRPHAPPVAFEPRGVGNHAGPRVIPVSDPAVSPAITPAFAAGGSSDGTDLAVVPVPGSEGLRRLRPDERQLRDSAPLILADRAYLYGAPMQPAGALQPVGLHRVATNAPRW